MISFGARKWQGEVLSTEVKNSKCATSGHRRNWHLYPEATLIHRDVSFIGMKNRDQNWSKLGKGTVGLLASPTDRWTHSNP